MPGSAPSLPGASASLPGGGRSTPAGDSRRGADSGDRSSSSQRRGGTSGKSGEGEQTATGSSAGADTTGKSSDDISFEEPQEASGSAASGQQPDGGDLSVDAAVDDQVLQEAFEVFGAQGKTSAAQPGDGTGQGSATSSGSAAAGSGSTADRIGELNAELDSALGTFDGAILAERDAAASDDNADVDGNDDAAGETTLDEESDDFGGGFSIPAMPAGAAPAAVSGKGNSNGNGTQPARAGDNRKGDYQHASAADAVPADIPDGSDDDVVARQIREAAQRETDPELREKLWDEYRKYKKGK